MKKEITLLAIIILVCTSFNPVNEETYTPVFMSRESLENSVRYISEAREMKQTGKIYFRAPYIYVNERYKGVHVINNSDPYNPVNEGFILAPGCIDMAVKGNIMYLDNSVDLVSFDLESKQVTKRLKNVFPEPLPPDDWSFSAFQNRPEGSVIVEWKKNR